MERVAGMTNIINIVRRDCNPTKSKIGFTLSREAWTASLLTSNQGNLLYPLDVHIYATFKTISLDAASLAHGPNDSSVP